MALQVGIVGLPNVGKSTLFNAVSAAGAEAANYPFATIEPNVGVVALRDERLETLARLNKSVKVVPTSVEFLDIAGLVKGASQGEGLGNQFLSHIREVDAIVHVVRCFDDPDIVHVDGSVDPVRDIEVIETELILKDLDTVDKRAQRTAKAARVGDKEGMREAEVVAALKAHLEGGGPARTFAFTDDDRVMRRELALLTDKPVLYAANVAESDLRAFASSAGGAGGNAYVDQVRAVAEKEGAEVIVVCAEAEAQISELPEDERAEFLADLGLERSGLDQLIHAAYRLLGLITFFTSGPTETRAWTIRQGMKAPQAAGQIHSDMERGFIRAETISYEVYAELGGEQAVKDAGKLRVEGKEYVVADGDVMHFRFNV